jgi:hypothetical protein
MEIKLTHYPARSLCHAKIKSIVNSQRTELELACANHIEL